jgi:hypothetical protein
MKKKLIMTALVLTMMLSLALATNVVLAGNKNNNGDNGYQGTNKPSNPLPLQSNVPEPAGKLEAFLGAPVNVTDGCRAGGGDVPIYEQGLGGIVDGGPCCKGPLIEDGQFAGAYEPNQCCNPPDIIFFGDTDFYTPGNHCLCFVMRMPWPPPSP